VLIRGGFKSCNCKTEMLILRELPARFAQVLMLRSLAPSNRYWTVVKADKDKASGPANSAAR